MSKEILKPCPFCGGKAEKKNYSASGFQCYWIDCEECGAEVLKFFKHETFARREKMLVELWNTRVDAKLSEITAERDRYKALVDEHLEKTKDGRIVVECNILYCPFCAKAVLRTRDETFYESWCEHCGRFISNKKAYADPDVARAAIEKGKA